MTDTFKKWGFKKDEAKIFDVPADKPSLPKGWHESPADIPKKAGKKDTPKNDDESANEAE